MVWWGANDISGSITSSHATGSVSGDISSVAGGLVGVNQGSITNSYATGSVSGSNGIGGLVGVNWAGSITNSYATGSVSGSADDVGGLVGWNMAGSFITACFSTGKVTGAGIKIGGFVGEQQGTVSLTHPSYWYFDPAGTQ